ncbi:MAG TPA: DinB family protein [Blastocatellia bacterium]|jgi:uncharacterized damage-inducible protein DinB|nr:DinB family protein [Blastocatellia bacterium]
METIETLRQLFSYNEWANRRTVDSLSEPANHNPKAVRALAHLLIAENAWLMRLQRNVDSTGVNFWEGSSLEECRRLFDEVSEAFRGLMSRLKEDDLDSKATYRNSKGVEYQTAYRDILQHVLMHSTYHRGQVAMAVRANGGEPVYTDYIAFVRES